MVMVVVVEEVMTYSVTWAAAGTGQGQGCWGNVDTRPGSVQQCRQSWPCVASWEGSEKQDMSHPPDNLLAVNIASP